MEEKLKKAFGIKGQSSGHTLTLYSFDQVAKKSLKSDLESVHLRIMSLPVGHPLHGVQIPPIHVYEYSGEGTGSAAFYLHSPVNGHSPAVYIRRDYLDALNAPEALSVILHEYGHPFRNHAKRVANALGAIDVPEALTRFLRTIECEADHVAGYLFPDHHREGVAHHLGNAMRISGEEERDRLSSPENTHPPMLRRLQRLRDSQLKDLAPGCIRFNEYCSVVPQPLPQACKMDGQQR